MTITRQAGYMEQLGARIRRLRTARGLAQDRLALEAHIDQSGLSKFERGKRALGETAIRRIAAVFDTSFEQLVAGTDFETKVGIQP